jgi:hypothetical protein
MCVTVTVKIIKITTTTPMRPIFASSDRWGLLLMPLDNILALSLLYDVLSSRNAVLIFGPIVTVVNRKRYDVLFRASKRVVKAS